MLLCTSISNSSDGVCIQFSPFHPPPLFLPPLRRLYACSHSPSCKMKGFGKKFRPLPRATKVPKNSTFWGSLVFTHIDSSHACNSSVGGGRLLGLFPEFLSKDPSTLPSARQASPAHLPVCTATQPPLQNLTLFAAPRGSVHHPRRAPTTTKTFVCMSQRTQKREHTQTTNKTWFDKKVFLLFSCTFLHGVVVFSTTHRPASAFYTTCRSTSYTKHPNLKTKRSRRRAKKKTGASLRPLNTIATALGDFGGGANRSLFLQWRPSGSKGANASPQRVPCCLLYQPTSCRGSMC